MKKFGWCHDNLHEECKVSYTMMWPPSDPLTKTRRGGGDVIQEEKEFSCGCECHA